MNTIWVCKPDGTIQCESNSIETTSGITLEEMRKELELIIGESNVLKMEKRSCPTVQACGFPTGNMNAYEITEQGWYILNHGIVGPQGFFLCPECSPDKSKSEVNIGQLIGALTAANPTNIQGLIGHPLRVYNTGDPITADYRPNRFNIEIGKKGLIVNVWFG